MVYIILAMFLYTAAILAGTAASRNANTNLVAAITNVVSAIIPIAVIIPALTKKTMQNKSFGIWMAVLDGMLVALFVMAINKSISLNKVGIVTPIIFGGAIFLSTILSYFIFKEKITMLEGVGLGILGVGFGIIIYARATV